MADDDMREYSNETRRIYLAIGAGGTVVSSAAAVLSYLGAMEHSVYYIFVVTSLILLLVSMSLLFSGLYEDPKESYPGDAKERSTAMLLIMVPGASQAYLGKAGRGLPFTAIYVIAVFSMLIGIIHLPEMDEEIYILMSGLFVMIASFAYSESDTREICNQMGLPHKDGRTTVEGSGMAMMMRPIIAAILIPLMFLIFIRDPMLFVLDVLLLTSSVGGTIYLLRLFRGNMHW